jgi:hypothetical protein
VQGRPRFRIGYVCRPGRRSHQARRASTSESILITNLGDLEHDLGVLSDVLCMVNSLLKLCRQLVPVPGSQEGLRIDSSYELLGSVQNRMQLVTYSVYAILSLSAFTSFDNASNMKGTFFLLLTIHFLKLNPFT